MPLISLERFKKINTRLYVGKNAAAAAAAAVSVKVDRFDMSMERTFLMERSRKNSAVRPRSVNSAKFSAAGGRHEKKREAPVVYKKKKNEINLEKNEKLSGAEVRVGRAPPKRRRRTRNRLTAISRA